MTDATPENPLLPTPAPSLSAADIPTGDTPAAEIPVLEIPAGSMSSAEIPPPETPSPEVPATNIPMGNIPMGSIPVASIPVASIPVAEVPQVVAPPVPPPVPRTGRLLGIDYGTRRLGFAVCNPEQTISSPVENYNRQSLLVDGKCVKRLVSEYRIVGLVVGLPIHLSGHASQKSREVREFAIWLQELTGLPLAFADERYSSAFAEEHLISVSLTRKKRKARLDMLAAQAILQGYLESGRDSEDPGALSDRPRR